MLADEELKTWFSSQIKVNMNSLYSVALRLTQSSTDAEDLVAESVTKAWSSIQTLGDRKRLRPWIFRIMHNSFVSDYRKQSIRPTENSYEEITEGESVDEIAQLLIEQPDEFLDWWANPESEFSNKLLGDDIMRAIESLPDVFKLAILLVNVEGMSYDEAAIALGVPPGTIRSRMKRGRTLLQKILWAHATDAGLVTNDTMREQTR